MASTPSASALSAVLRCRGKLWARNPQTKRPQAAYGLRGPASAPREAPTSPWESFRRGERVLVAGGLELQYRTRTDCLCGPRMRQTPGREPLSRLLLWLSPALSGPTPGLHWGHRPGPGSVTGVLKLAVRSKSWSWFSAQDAGRSPWTWSGLRGSLLSLTALVSSILPVSPALGSGPGRPEDGAPSSSIQNQINTVTSFSDETSSRRITEDRPD